MVVLKEVINGSVNNTILELLKNRIDGDWVLGSYKNRASLRVSNNTYFSAEVTI